MDKYSFLNAAHTAYFAELYDQYLQYPDSVEPSWRAFFQGFDFGMESSSNGHAVIEHPQNGEAIEIPEPVVKEFQVVNLIEGYRTRGHLLTWTFKISDWRKVISKPHSMQGRSWVLALPP